MTRPQYQPSFGSASLKTATRGTGIGTGFGLTWETLVFPLIKQLADLEPQTLITALVTLGGLNIDFSWVFTALVRLASLARPWAEVIGLLASQMHRFIQTQAQPQPQAGAETGATAFAFTSTTTGG